MRVVVGKYFGVARQDFVDYFEAGGLQALPVSVKSTTASTISGAFASVAP